MVHETRTANTVTEGIGNMIDAMKRDYCEERDWPEGRERFCNGFSVKTGSKYARVFSNRSVSAFVVVVDNDKKFRLGDILKPAGYSAPARNGARGNVLDGGYHINWTGPLYLK